MKGRGREVLNRRGCSIKKVEGRVLTEEGQEVGDVDSMGR